MKYDVKSLTKSIIEISAGVESNKHYLVNLKSIECIEMYTDSSSHTRVNVRMVGSSLSFEFDNKQEAMFLYNDITANMVLMEDENNSQFNDLPKEFNVHSEELDELDMAMNLREDN